MSTASQDARRSRVSRITEDYRDTRALGDSIPKALWSVVDTRGCMGWALKDAGWALIHAGNRVLRETPTTLDAEWAAGVGFARRHYFTRAQYEAFIREAGVEPTDDVMAKFGFGAKAEGATA